MKNIQYLIPCLWSLVQSSLRWVFAYYTESEGLVNKKENPKGGMAGRAGMSSLWQLVKDGLEGCGWSITLMS